MRKTVAVLLALLLLGAAAPARDWRTVVSEDAKGWTFGRSGAPRLVEYGSFGCPHCGHFSAEAGPGIDKAVKAGKLRFTFSPYLIFPQDRAASVLARCVPAAKRLAYIEDAYAKLADTRAKLAAADDDERLRGELYQAELAGPAPHAAAIARISGLKDLAAAHGLAPAAADRCLADPANHDWVSNADLAARAAGVAGTPTFEWGGQRLARDLTPQALVAMLPR